MQDHAPPTTLSPWPPKILTTQALRAGALAQRALAAAEMRARAARLSRRFGRRGEPFSETVPTACLRLGIPADPKSRWSSLSKDSIRSLIWTARFSCDTVRLES